jgi:hypothetical protein
MSEAIDLAKPQPEPPTGGEARTVLLCAVFLFYTLRFNRFVKFVLPLL